VWAGSREWRGNPLSTIATGILADETWDLATLEPVLAYVDRTEPSRTCHSIEARDAAIVRAYAVEEAYAFGPHPDGPLLLDKARREVRHYLTCHPHEGFFWYILFRLELIAGQTARDALPFLEMSYRLAPHEAWIMRRRNLHAALQFADLPPGLQARVRSEFVLLVRDVIDDAVTVILSVDEPTQHELLAGVADLPLKDRRALAAQLDALDVLVDVPGVDYKQTQPWRQ